MSSFFSPFFLSFGWNVFPPCEIYGQFFPEFPASAESHHACHVVQVVRQQIATLYYWIMFHILFNYFSPPVSRKHPTSLDSDLAVALWVYWFRINCGTHRLMASHTLDCSYGCKSVQLIKIVGLNGCKWLAQAQIAEICTDLRAYLIASFFNSTCRELYWQIDHNRLSGFIGVLIEAIDSWDWNVECFLEWSMDWLEHEMSEMWTRSWIL